MKINYNFDNTRENNLDKIKKQLENVEYLHIIVDALNGFLVKGALADPSMQRIIPEIERLAQMHEENPNGLNISGEDWHTKQSVEFLRFEPHTEQYTTEADIVDELKPYKEGGLTFKKNSTNLVLAPGFIDFAKKTNNLKTVVISGVLYDICVKKCALTLRDLFDELNRNVVIIIPLTAVDTFNGPNHNREETFEKTTKELENGGIQIIKKLGERF